MVLRLGCVVLFALNGCALVDALGGDETKDDGGVNVDALPIVDSSPDGSLIGTRICFGGTCYNTTEQFMPSVEPLYSHQPDRYRYRAGEWRL